MDIVTYAALHGITVEDAKAVLGSDSAQKGQDTQQEVSPANPRDYIPVEPGRHYAGRGAARSVPLAYTHR